MQKPPVYGALTSPRLTPAQTVEALERKLDPATDWQIDKALAYLTANLPLREAADEMQLAAKMEGFVDCCRGYPSAALDETIRAFVNGRVAGCTDGFCPNPQVLGAELSRRVSHDRDRLAAAKRVAAQAEILEAEAEAGPISPGLRERVQQRLADLREASRLDRESLACRAPAHPELDQFKGEIGNDGRRLPIRETLPSRIGYAGSPSKPVEAEDVTHLPDAPPKGAVAAAGAMRPIGGAFMPRLK